MEKIKGIGVWGCEEDSEYPDIITFIDTSWDEELRNKVVGYLENIQPFVVAACRDKCILKCKMDSVPVGTSTDGVFCWPLDFIHYISDHGVRPPDDFVEHILKNAHHMPTFKNEDIFSYFHKIDYDWWKAQKGWSDESTIFQEKIGRLLLKPICVKMTQDIIGFLRKYKCMKTISTMELYEIIKNKEQLLLDDNSYYSDYIAILPVAKELGLNIDFIENI